MEENKTESLKIKKLTGGSLIEHRPVFSGDGKYIFIVCNDVVKCYSTETFECVRDLTSGSGNPVVAVEMDKGISSRLILCDSKGEVSTWHWKTGLLETKMTLSLGEEATVLAFKLVYFKNSALVSWIDGVTGVPAVCIMNYDTNTRVSKYKMDSKVMANGLGVAAKGLHYFALIQGSRLFILDVQSNNGEPRRIETNQNRDHFTIITCHPEHDTIATGDVKGRIRIWRNIMSGEKPKIDLYHWHHTPVNTLAFSTSGTIFYSGGSEAVLVKWVINEPHNRKFLPRMSSEIAHVAVGSENSTVVVATKDNALHIFDAQLNLIKMIQNFTWIPNDYTGLNPFPVGLQVNPRTQSIVMNGTSGHLQFFSTHTNTLLYNLDITGQNYQCPEQSKLLFNTRVTQCALNINWMATSEVWDDFQHTPQIRLKFWMYSESKQTFILNTNVEMPHNKGINQLKFSSDHCVENLLLASAGKDRTLKLWAQEDTKNIYRQGKVWMCINVFSYKDLPVHSIAFSSDCSGLAAGFGNVLCVFDTDTFKMECALAAPNALDGGVGKVQISVGRDSKVTRDLLSKRDFYMNEVKKYLRGEKNDLLKDLESKGVSIKPMTSLNTENLTSSQRKEIFKQITTSSDLTFDQKVHVLHSLGLSYDTVNHLKGKIAGHLYRRRKIVKNLLKTLPSNIRQLKRDAKFRQLASYSLLQRRRIKQGPSNIKWFEHFIESQSKDYKKREYKPNKTEETNETSSNSMPIKMPVTIKTVLFGAEDYSHLICVCTSDRILIWNLLNLHLQSSYIYSAKFACIDTQTNLVAALSYDNQLIVFHINSPLPIYTHNNFPDIAAMTWVPRRYPKGRTSVIDWQAASQLFFLNTDQELIFIDDVSQTHENEGSSKAILYMNSGDDKKFKYDNPFASILAERSSNHARKETQNWNTKQLGVYGRSVVKELTQLQTHAMPPLHLLSEDFLRGLSIKSLETTNAVTDTKLEISEEKNELTSSGFDEEEFEDESQEFLDRKELLLKMEALTKSEKVPNHSYIDTIITKGNFDVSLA